MKYYIESYVCKSDKIIPLLGTENNRIIVAKRITSVDQYKHLLQHSRLLGQAPNTTHFYTVLDAYTKQVVRMILVKPVRYSLIKDYFGESWDTTSCTIVSLHHLKEIPQVIKSRSKI